MISYAGWTTPSIGLSTTAPAVSLKTIFEVKPAADYSKIRVTRVEGTSKDGSKIPVTVIAMDGITPSGKRPLILYG